MTLGFKIAETTHIYNSVVNSLKNAGFRIVGPNSSKWNVMWTGQTKPEHLKDATRYQKINHFPQSFQIGRKDLMWKNLSRMRRVFPEYNFCPKTYLFPDDYRKFVMDRENDNYKHMYIMKPIVHPSIMKVFLVLLTTFFCKYDRFLDILLSR